MCFLSTRYEATVSVNLHNLAKSVSCIIIIKRFAFWYESDMLYSPKLTEIRQILIISNAYLCWSKLRYSQIGVSWKLILIGIEVCGLSEWASSINWTFSLAGSQLMWQNVIFLSIFIKYFSQKLSKLILKNMVAFYSFVHWVYATFLESMCAG